MSDDKKTRGPRRKYITQPCRLPLPNGDVAEVIIRFPESAAREVHWQITSETVLITTGEKSTLVIREPTVQRAPAGEPVVPRQVSAFHSSAISLEEEIEKDPELIAARESGASDDDIEEILAKRRMSSPPLRIASTRGADIAKQAAVLRRISVDVDGQHVEHELSATGGTS